MRTIVLITSDDRLHSRLAAGLRVSDELLCYRALEAIPSSLTDPVDLVVFDLRDDTMVRVARQLAAARAALGFSCRTVAICAGPAARGIQVLNSVDRKALDVLLEDCDPLPDLIRAHLNDSSRTTSFAITLEVLLDVLPNATHETVRYVIGGGFSVSSVNELAASYGRERTTVAKALRSQTTWTPREIIDVAQACAAAVLLRITELPVSDVALAVRRGKPRSLRSLLRKVFQMTADAIREGDDSSSAKVWIRRLLTDFVDRREQLGHSALGRTY